jgi:hypothetical protein
MNSAKTNINDFHIIKNGSHKFTPQMAYDLHMIEREYIKTQLELNRGRKMVVVTHFMPSYLMVHEKWKTASTDTLNHYFSANCDDLIMLAKDCGAVSWVCGHTHDRRDIVLGDLPCYCNPLGYPKENPDYQNMVIEF